MLGSRPAIRGQSKCPTWMGQHQTLAWAIYWTQRSSYYLADPAWAAELTVPSLVFYYLPPSNSNFSSRCPSSYSNRPLVSFLFLIFTGWALLLSSLFLLFLENFQLHPPSTIYPFPSGPQLPRGWSPALKSPRPERGEPHTPLPCPSHKPWPLSFFAVEQTGQLLIFTYL